MIKYINYKPELCIEATRLIYWMRTAFAKMKSFLISIYVWKYNCRPHPLFCVKNICLLSYSALVHHCLIKVYWNGVFITMNLATLSPFGSHFRPELPFCTCTQLYSNADQNSVSKKFDFHGRFEMIFYHFHTFSGEKLALQHWCLSSRW